MLRLQPAAGKAAAAAAIAARISWLRHNNGPRGPLLLVLLARVQRGFCGARHSSFPFLQLLRFA